MAEMFFGLGFLIGSIIAGIITKDVNWIIASGLFYIGLAEWNRRGW